MVGNAAELRWEEKYVKDEWGRVQVQEVIVPKERDADGAVLRPAYTLPDPVLNSVRDPSRSRVPRRLRSEWASVGLSAGCW